MLVNPEPETVEPVNPAEPSLKPTRKWWVTQVTALAALATMYLTTGAWDTEESVAAVGIVAQAAIAWLVPNQVTLPATGVESKVEAKSNV
jgi:hypothetical protein